jgi:hypothetical protein
VRRAYAPYRVKKFKKFMVRARCLRTLRGKKWITFSINQLR